MNIKRIFPGAMVVGVSLPTALDQTNHIFSLFLLIKITKHQPSGGYKLCLFQANTRCCRIASLPPSETLSL